MEEKEGREEKERGTKNERRWRCEGGIEKEK
jgi:hypothetical protein